MAHVFVKQLRLDVLESPKEQAISKSILEERQSPPCKGATSTNGLELLRGIIPHVLVRPLGEICSLEPNSKSI